jgi:hypothetical protein
MDALPVNALNTSTASGWVYSNARRTSVTAGPARGAEFAAHNRVGHRVA